MKFKNFLERENVKAEYHHHFTNYLLEMIPDLTTEIMELHSHAKLLFGDFCSDYRDSRISPTAYLVNDCIWDFDEILTDDCLDSIARVSGEYRVVALSTIVRRQVSENEYTEFLNNHELDPVAMVKKEQELTHDLSKFNEGFFQILDKYNIRKLWLACWLFRLVWSRDVTMEFPRLKDITYDSRLFVDLLDAMEIDHTLDPDEKFYFSRSALLPNPYKFKEPIDPERLREYVENAIRDFKEHLEHQINEILPAFEKHGYVQKRRPHNFERLRWLVRWTANGWDKPKILDEIAENEGKYTDVSTLDKAFQRFSEYDLPVHQEP